MSEKNQGGHEGEGKRKVCGLTALLDKDTPCCALHK